MLGWVFLFPLVTEAACLDFPAAFDIERLSYTVEKIASSAHVEITFPKLSTHASCTSRPAHFGTLWEWAIDSTAPLQILVRDRNKVIVQSFSYTGNLSLKTTPNRATLHFYSLHPSKNLLDHRIVSVELWNDSPLAALPSFDVEDVGVRIRISGSQTLTK